MPSNKDEENNPGKPDTPNLPTCGVQNPYEKNIQSDHTTIPLHLTIH